MGTELVILEAARLALQVYFMNIRLAGKTDEEIERIYSEERDKFIRNRPEDLPEIPDNNPVYDGSKTDPA